MSRAERLFNKLDLSLKNTYSSYIGKEIYIVTTPGTLNTHNHLPINWCRGKVVSVCKDKLSLINSSSDCSISSSFSMEFDTIESIHLAGESMYDEIIRKRYK